MRIRVVADTTQAEREVERAGDRIERLQRKLSLGTDALRFTRHGYGLYRDVIPRNLRGPRLRGRLPGAVTEQAASKGKQAARVAGRALLRAVSNLHPALKALAVATAAVGATKLGKKLVANSSFTQRLTQQIAYMREASRVHTAAVEKATAASIASRESFEKFQARSAAKADPYLRSVEFHQQRLQSMGAAITQYQSAVLTSLADSQRRLDEQRAARDRTVATLTAPFKEFGRDVTRLGVRVQTWVGQQATEPGGLGDAAVAGTMGFPGAAPLAAGYLGMKYYYGARSAADLAIAQGQAKTAQATADELMRLQMRGPAATTAGIPTIRPGTAAGHTFRVRQEREELQREATRVWQDRILELMRALVEASRMDPEAVARTEIQFGREPGAAVIGVE
jgi:hypothetical protein